MLRQLMLCPCDEAVLLLMRCSAFGADAVRHVHAVRHTDAAGMHMRLDMHLLRACTCCGHVPVNGKGLQEGSEMLPLTRMATCLTLKLYADFAYAVQCFIRITGLGCKDTGSGFIQA